MLVCGVTLPPRVIRRGGLKGLDGVRAGLDVTETQAGAGRGIGWDNIRVMVPAGGMGVG